MKTLLVTLAVITALVCGVTCQDYLKKWQPCGSENISLDCVKQFLASNSKCKVVDSPPSTPHYTDKLPIYVSSINTTVVTSTVLPSGLDGVIEEFYIEYGALVISVNFEGLVCEAPGTIFSIADKPGTEPKVIREYIKAVYPTILTAAIQFSNDINELSWIGSFINAYFETSNAQFKIGPAFSQSSDPVISDAYNSLLADIPTALEEIFRTKSSYFFLIYLQNIICDFGVAPNLQDQIDITVLKNILDNDKDRSIVEPCTGRDNLRECVAEYFLEKGDCGDVGIPNDDPVTRTALKTYAPALNVTAVPMNAQLTGLDGTIEAFYINEATNNLVFTVSFPNLGMESKIVPLVIEQRGAKPKVYTDANKDSYDVTINAVIPLNNGLTRKAIEDASVSTTVNSKSSFEIKHSYSRHEDEQVAKILDKLYEYPTLITKELFVTEGASSFRAFIQKYICQFDGLSLIVN